MIFNIPNRENFEIKTIVLDLNGTLAIKGKLVPGSAKRIKKLEKLGYKIILLTGNQRGNADKLCKSLGIEYKVCKNAEEKENAMLSLEPEHCAAIGNARIDIGTFKHAKISILTLQKEGIHVDVIPFTDIIVPSVVDALDLFIDKDSFIATMK